jgi:hypothetical protein
LILGEQILSSEASLVDVVRSHAGLPRSRRILLG